MTATARVRHRTCVLMPPELPGDGSGRRTGGGEPLRRKGQPGHDDPALAQRIGHTLSPTRLPLPALTGVAATSSDADPGGLVAVRPERSSARVQRTGTDRHDHSGRSAGSASRRRASRRSARPHTSFGASRGSVRAVVARGALAATHLHPVRRVVAGAPEPRRVHERLRELQRMAVRGLPVRVQPPLTCATAPATPGSGCPTPPAAPGSACCCRPGAGAGTAPTGASPASARATPRRGAGRGPRTALNPRQWRSSISASQCRRSSGRIGRTSTSRTTASHLSHPANMRPAVHQPPPKSQCLSSQSSNCRLPASVKWSCSLLSDARQICEMRCQPATRCWRGAPRSRRSGFRGWRSAVRGWRWRRRRSSACRRA